MKECDKEIVRNYVHSTKKWIYRYILDRFDEIDTKYSCIKLAVDEINEFQDEILEQLDKEESQSIIGDETLKSIERERMTELSGKVIKSIRYGLRNGCEIIITIETDDRLFHYGVDGIDKPLKLISTTGIGVLSMPAGRFN